MSSFSSALLNIFLIAIIIWFIVLIIAIITLTKRKDIVTPAKAFWSAVIFFAPVVGLIFYLMYGFKNKRRDITKY